MTQFKKVTTKAKHSCAVSMFVMCAPALALAQSSADLGGCSTIEDDAKRVACYDEIAGGESTVQEVTTEDAVAISGQEAAESEELAPLTDDVGAEGLNKKETEDDDKPVRGRITSCRKDSFGDYFFSFDNGQVWKEKSDNRLYFKECDFSVTISRDFFGYKMQIDGEKGRIRIARVK
jgi:hypothetical protein